MIDATLTRWIARFKRKAPQSKLPLGISEQQLDSLKLLQASAHWQHYLRVLEALGEQQAAELASGLPHEKYLFASGALTALRRVYTLVDDLVASAQTLEKLTNARADQSVRAAARHADTFVNTPWYDGWRRDTVDRTSR